MESRYSGVEKSQMTNWSTSWPGEVKDELPIQPSSFLLSKGYGIFKLGLNIVGTFGFWRTALNENPPR